MNSHAEDEGQDYLAIEDRESQGEGEDNTCKSTLSSLWTLGIALFGVLSTASHVYTGFIYIAAGRVGWGAVTLAATGTYLLLSASIAPAILPDLLMQFIKVKSGSGLGLAAMGLGFGCGILGLTPVVLACQSMRHGRADSQKSMVKIHTLLKVGKMVVETIPLTMLHVYIVLLTQLGDSMGEYGVYEWAWMRFNACLSVLSASYFICQLRMGEANGYDMRMFQLSASAESGALWLAWKVLTTVQATFEVCARSALIALVLVAFKGAALIGLVLHHLLILAVMSLLGADDDGYGDDEGDGCFGKCCRSIPIAVSNLLASYMPLSRNSSERYATLAVHVVEGTLIVVLCAVPSLRLSESSSLAGGSTYGGVCSSTQIPSADNCVPEWYFHMLAILVCGAVLLMFLMVKLLW